MTPLERAFAYAKKCPPAISGNGGHDDTYHLACELINGFALNSADTLAVLVDWNMWCQPPWSLGELNHKVHCASNAKHKHPHGWRLRNNEQLGTFISPVNKAVISGVPTSKESLTVPQLVKDSPVIHSPIPSALSNPTLALLKAAFLEGEGVSMVDAVFGKDGKSIPSGSGIVLTREEWVNKLEARGGDPNKIWSSEDKPGGFIRLNPMRLGGSSTDADVTAYRHALLEFDTTSLDEQWRIISSSKIPCTAVVYSGAKSLHAWVKVDAKDRLDYGLKVKELLEHFSQYSPDPKNKNPSRLARLAGMQRGEKIQTLIAVGIGAKSWSAWKAGLSTIGNSVMRVSDLLQVDTDHDPNSMIGKRWLCRGHTCLLVGPSGIGKSTLTMQFAVSWAIGLPVFGIKPKKQLRSLVIQAENDEGDLSEQLKATLNAKPRWNTSEVVSGLNENLIFVRETISTGFAFCEKLQTLIDTHKPDLVWVDPLLSYIGDDISSQKVVSTFLRNWIAPILESTGVILFLIHHIRKPSKDDAGKSALELQYLAAGSSEVTNFSRAVIYLESTSGNTCNIHLAKRGKRAEAVGMDGKLTTCLSVKHSETGPTWEQCEPVLPEATAKVVCSKTPPRNPAPNPEPSDISISVGTRWSTYLEALTLIRSTCGCDDASARVAFAKAKDNDCFEIDSSRTPKIYRWKR